MASWTFLFTKRVTFLMNVDEVICINQTVSHKCFNIIEAEEAITCCIKALKFTEPSSITLLKIILGLKVLIEGIITF